MADWEEALRNLPADELSNLIEVIATIRDTAFITQRAYQKLYDFLSKRSIRLFNLNALIASDLENTGIGDQYELYQSSSDSIYTISPIDLQQLFGTISSAFGSEMALNAMQVREYNELQKTLGVLGIYINNFTDIDDNLDELESAVNSVLGLTGEGGQGNPEA